MTAHVCEAPHTETAAGPSLLLSSRRSLPRTPLVPGRYEPLHPPHASNPPAERSRRCLGTRKGSRPSGSRNATSTPAGRPRAIKRLMPS